MIEINLLPESMRKTEATPLPRFIAICGGVLLVGALLVWNLFLVKEAAKKDQELTGLKKVFVEKKKAAQQLDDLEAKIEGINAHVGVVRDLYKKRRIWAKLLFDIKRIVTHDKNADESNSEKRYLWLNKLSYQKAKRDGNDYLQMEGYATNADQPTAALVDVQRLLRNMIDYKADKGPEIEEKARLEKELVDLQESIAERQKSWDALRRENPALAAKSPEVLALEEDKTNLEKTISDLAEHESGRVAVTPFREFFEPGEIRLTNADWKDSPSPADALKEAENMPTKVQLFKLRGVFKKPKEKAPVALGRRR